jgi:hypothetical protein
MLRVTGLADAVLLDPQNPLNPVNRRISIILLNKAAEMAVRNEGKLKTTVLDPYLKEIDPPKTAPVQENKTSPAIETPVPPVQVPEVKAIQKSEVIPPVPPVTTQTTRVDKPIPSATTIPSKSENTTKLPAFQAIPKNQIIQLEKPIPSKN